MTNKSEDRVEHLNTILARGSGNFPGGGGGGRREDVEVSS